MILDDPSLMSSQTPKGLPGAVSAALERHEREQMPRLRVLWAYFLNPADVSWWRDAAAGLSRSARARLGRTARLAQERGLPARFFSGTQVRPAVGDARREVVIENDIGWRVRAMVDYLVGRPVRVRSTAEDPGVRAAAEEAVRAAWEASGGHTLLQDAALVGHVYGHVDFVVRFEGEGLVEELSGAADARERVMMAARRVRIEMVDATRGVAVLDGGDYRRITAYAVRVERAGGDGRRLVDVEVFGGEGSRVYRGDERGLRAVSDGSENVVSPGRVPVVHVQNAPMPLRYEGGSEVEPLIPLQDELNTRLSDRANRVTLQSFKMYLAKGVDGFERTGVGPGTVWSTDNPEASITAFGGDAASPSEESHVAEVREALDKASGVPPLATGAIGGRIGNLTSENALRLTLQGLVTRTARKRVAYGRGISAVSELVLSALDRAGVLSTRVSERGFRVEWQDAAGLEGA